MGLLDDLKNKLLGSKDADNQLSNKFRSLINGILEEESKNKTTLWNIKLGNTASGKSILALNPDDSVEIVRFCLLNIDEYYKSKISKEKIQGYKISDIGHKHAANIIETQIIRQFLNRKLVFTKNDLGQLLDWIIGRAEKELYSLPIAGVIFALENNSNSIDNQFNSQLKALRNILGEYPNVEMTRLKERVYSLLNEKILLNDGEAWSDAALVFIHTMNHEQKIKWQSLINHTRKATTSKPSKSWIASMKNIVDEINATHYFETCREWFVLVDKPSTKPREVPVWPDDPYHLDETNCDVLKGLVWSFALLESADNARSLVKLATSCYKKIPGVGPRAIRVGNACIAALAAMPGRIGLYHLAVMQMKLKYRSALKLVTNALEEAAKREGISVQELEEMGVPSYGLDRVGYGEEIIGDYTAILNVTEQKTVELTWRSIQDKIQKTIPVRIKSDFAQELKEIRGAMADIKTMISAQKDRLEKMFLQEPQWTFDIWQERYLNHPIVGIHARKLIWEFSSDESSLQGIYHDGKIIDSKGTELALDNSWKVKLWHPINSTIDLIKDWRNQIESLQIVQPFKQAHREIYLLTEAELNTRVYSNRFASHIIKQHQFNALCSTRGWRYSLQGAWDGGDVIARVDLDRFNLWAEFWVHSIGEYGADTSEAGIFNYVSTDQVRFYVKQKSLNDINETNINNVTPVALSEINPLVFSEVFRDVDLFVGVCSVGNDTQWSDGGADDRFRSYWHSYSFGDLSAGAETRKEFLQKLLPKLKIGSQCKIVDRFLVVAGKRRTYKIHLGSGNILMEPNNQYLCIVPGGRDKTKGDSIFLPFEGDNMLSIIISKAIMLADDDKIKDSSINSQIGNH